MRTLDNGFSFYPDSERKSDCVDFKIYCTHNRVDCILLPIFFFFTSSGPALGPTQPPIQWVSGALSPQVNRPGREANHSPPTSAKIKETWIYTSTPSYVFMAYCLII
jgi:hypothetical protein